MKTRIIAALFAISLAGPAFAQDSQIPNGGGSGGGAVTQATSPWVVAGPTADGSPAANPPVLVGGTVDGTAIGNVGVIKVSAGGVVSVDGSAFTQPVSSATFATVANQTTLITAFGAQTDATCSTANGTCSFVSLMKFLNVQAGNPPPLNLNGTNTAWTGVTPGVAQTGTIVGANMDISSIKGVAPLTGNGATGTGSWRETIASDNSAIPSWGHGATGVAVPSGATYQGGNAVSAEPAKATTGNLTGATYDLAGKIVTSPYSLRESQLHCAITLTASTAATTCTGMEAQGASVKIYVTDLTCTRSDAATTSATMTLNDSAARIIDMPNNGGGGGFVRSYSTPLQIAANTPFQVQSGTSLTSVHCSADGFKGY